MASKLRDEVIRQMTLRSFAPKTHINYLHAIEELSRYYWRSPDQLSCKEVQLFLIHLIQEKKRAWATVNVYFSAYRFLYEQVLGWDKKLFSIPPRGRSGKRPGVLSHKEALKLINAPKNLKHRALLSLTYGSGLRVSEVVRVQPVHLDRGRMMLRVEQGKGHRDRYTILAKKTLRLLDRLQREAGSLNWYFPGKDKEQPLSVCTAQMVYESAIRRSGVRRVGGIHVLRHCFATHLMEQGVDIFTIKKWMGHRSLTTTSRYMHVTAEHLASVKSPLDILFQTQ